MMIMSVLVGDQSYIYIYPVNKKPAKIRSVEKKFIRKFDFKAVKCPVHKKDYPKKAK